MEVAELAPGLWRWTARHPEWSEGEDWPPEVGCVYWEAPDAVCLVDPLVPVEPAERERFWKHLDADVERAGAPVAVLLTISFHARSAAEIAARYGAAVWAWHEEAHPPEVSADRRYAAGDELPGGFVAYGTGRKEGILWLPARKALVAGDVLLGGPLRVCPWFLDAAGRERAVRALRDLLALEVELVLTAHGEPVLANGRAALAAALDA